MFEMRIVSWFIGELVMYSWDLGIVVGVPVGLLVASFCMKGK